MKCCIQWCKAEQLDVDDFCFVHRAEWNDSGEATRVEAIWQERCDGTFADWWKASECREHLALVDFIHRKEKEGA